MSKIFTQQELTNSAPISTIELFEKTKLNFNLSDNCSFQPIHIQINHDKLSAIVIARFTSRKIDGIFKLCQIEFLGFEITKKMDNDIFLEINDVIIIEDTTENHLNIEFNVKTTTIQPNITVKYCDIDIYNYHFIDVKIEKYNGIDLEDLVSRERHCGGKINFN